MSSAGRRFAQPIDVKRRRRPKSTSDNHPLPRADAVVTGGAKNIETFLTAQQNLSIKGQRQLLYRFVADFAGIEWLVGIQLSAGYGSLDLRARSSLILEEIAFLQRLIARLIGHFLLARQQTKTDREPAPARRFCNEYHVRQGSTS